MTGRSHPRLGAVPTATGTEFLVWAPLAERVDVRVLSPEPRAIPMERLDRGYHRVRAEGVGAGTTYTYLLDRGEGVGGGRELADPASRSQPEGVHGPSAVVDPASFQWSDHAFEPPNVSEYVIYELHVGAFSEAGTFDAAIEHLDWLVDLGVTAVEPMPIAEFPGTRNWGYDGVFPFAAQSSYGGPHGFARFVDAAHARGLALVLDVVYNHLGPEGSVHREFGPYFTDRYRTPWGDAVNVDGPWSDEVRRYFVENAAMWFRDFHVDALRLDAIHGIVDTSARPFLQELGEAVGALSEELGRPLFLIAESDLNDPQVIRPTDRGGLGLHAQWSDDFHHAIHAFLTGERSGYYRSFGELDHLARVLRSGYTYTGQYSPYRERRFGAPPDDIPPERFVVYSQNHDQVGNRMLGDRLGSLIPFEQQKVAAGLVLLSPFVPLLFMGEEYGETAPFQYFISHLDPALVEAVRRGRAEEFASFDWSGEPPDPQAEETFLEAKLDRKLREKDEHGQLWNLYRELIRLRRDHPAFRPDATRSVQVSVDPERSVLTLLRTADRGRAVVAFHLGDGEAAVDLPSGAESLLVSSEDERWGGPGTPGGVPGGGAWRMGPWSFAVWASLL